MFFFVWDIGNKFVSLPHNLLIKYEMIHYSNILPPIQCDSLIKRSIATLYDVLCLIEESSILSIKEQSTYFFTNLLRINKVILHPLYTIRG